MDNRIFIKIKEGEIIPEFNLKNIEGEVFASDEFLRKKNLVIFFFNDLKDKCCADYLLKLNKVYAKLKQENSEILAVSENGGPGLKEFAESNNLKFHLLLDADRAVMDKFTYKDKQGNNIGAVFITDKFQSLYSSYFHQAFGKLPQVNEIVRSVEFLEKQCPECGVSTWTENAG